MPVVRTGVIDASDIGRFVFSQRCVEAETDEVQTAIATLSRIITGRVLLEGAVAALPGE